VNGPYDVGLAGPGVDVHGQHAAGSILGSLLTIGCLNGLKQGREDLWQTGG
jgi:hypothetical protein